MSEREPDNYSIDEMMRRLQSRGRQDLEGEPEMVTRADGTQALRVRKRKRRSFQPHKEAERLRRRRVMIGVTLSVLFVLGLGLSLLGWFFYLNSGSYQDKLEERIEAWTGADLKLRAFRATPVNAAADYIELNWSEESPVAKAHLHHPRTDLGILSHLTGIWQGQQLMGSSARVQLRAVPEVKELELPQGPMPFQVPLRAGNLDIRFGEKFAIYKAAATLSIADPMTPEPNLVLQKGGCRLRGWGRYTIDFASLRWNEQGVELGTMQLVPWGEEDAEYEVFGEGFAPVPVTGGVAELGLKVREMPAFALIGNGLGALLEGTFETSTEDTSSRFYLDATDVDSIRIDATVHSSAGSSIRFYRFPMFEVLGDIFDSVRLVQPRFDPESSLRVVRSAEKVALKDLNLVAEGLLQIRGEISEEPGARLAGRLRVGVAESLMVLADTPAAASVFGEVEDGYHWATVQMGGTLKQPADNLRAQITGADEAVSPATGGERALEDEFQNLTSPDSD